MTTQKWLLIIGCFFYSFTCFGQQKPKIHEVGLAFNAGLDFSAFYKAGGPKSLFRLKALLLKGSNSYNQNRNVTNSSFGVGIGLGAEFRKNIVDNIYFVYGFDVNLSYWGTSTVSHQVNRSTSIISPGINFVLGINYVLKEHWVFSLELLPYLNYNMGFNQDNFQIKSEPNSFTYGVDLKSIQLGIAYRFYKNKKATN